MLQDPAAERTTRAQGTDVNVVSINTKRSVRRAAAPTTVEALMWSIRNQGVAALTDQDNAHRLAELTPLQIGEVIVRLNALRHSNPLITDELLARLIKIGRLT